MSTFEATVGVLALQGAFSEHIQLLRQAAAALKQRGVSSTNWSFIEVRTPAQLAACDALILPGGESTTMSLVAERSGLLEPLREFVKSVLPTISLLHLLMDIQSTPQTHLGDLRRTHPPGRVG